MMLEISADDPQPADETIGFLSTTDEHNHSHAFVLFSALLFTLIAYTILIGERNRGRAVYGVPTCQSWQPLSGVNSCHYRVYGPLLYSGLYALGRGRASYVF